MSVKRESSGRRWVQVEVEVPGTPEEVWQAIATGPGISSWFVPTEFEERDGKPVAVTLNFGPGMESRSTVTAWDPPRKFAAQGEGWGGASVAHAVTRSVRDSAALLDATAGPNVGDPYWAPPSARPFLEEVGRAPRPLRIALTTRPWNGQTVDPECETAARDAAHLCASLGHTVEEARPEADVAALGAATYVVIGANLRATLEARAAALGRPLEETDVERITWSHAMQGHTARAADYARAIGIMHRIGRQVAPFFERYDALLSPTMCRPPYRLGVIDMMTLDAAGYSQAVLSTIAFSCSRSAFVSRRSLARWRSSPPAAPSKTRSTKSRTMAPTTCWRGFVGL